MITGIAEFLRYFDGVNRRALRDVGSLPAAAQSWKPSGGHGEDGWTIGELVGHMTASRVFFADEYRGEGWHPKPWSEPTTTREQWVAALNESGQQMQRLLGDTPDEWLQRRIESIDTPGQTVAGWRLLMMCVEHDIHHRSQIDTYAGIEGWEVQQIFGRRAEDVGLSPPR